MVRARLNTEADRRIADVGRRTDSAVARATVVVGAAVILAGIPSVGWHGWLHLIVTVLALAACVLAVLVLAFRPAKEVPVREFTERAAEYTAPVLEKQLLQLKVDVIASDEDRLNKLAQLLLASFLCFATGALFALISAATGI